ncbi:MAG: ABC transporter permease [Anaerolineaceae bacterium]|nr:ABC transporter permease [Anaerolineaceae bacterium]MBN2678067.1 ABC transporter permease [Anaerolineaceae bacterium]
MKYLLSIACNTLKIDFSRRGTWISVLVLPLIFTLVIGVTSSGLGMGGDTRIPIALVDQDGGPLSKAFTDTLGKSEEVVYVAVDEPTSMEYLQNMTVVMVIILPPGFSQNLQNGNGSTITMHYFEMNNLAIAAREAIQPAIARVTSAVLSAQLSLSEGESLRPFTDEAERQAYFERGLALAEEQSDLDPIQVDLVMAGEQVRNNPIMGFKTASPGQLVTWLLFTLMSGSVILVSERKDGTLSRMMASPAPRWAIMGGKLLGRLTLGMLQASVLILFGQFALGVEWGGDPLALVLLTICFGLSATSLGLLISTLSRSEQQASTLSLMGMFLLAPLGGAWFPLEITPRAFQQAVQVFPTTWAMNAYLDLILRGGTLADITLACITLLGFAAVFFIAGLWRFRFE